MSEFRHAEALELNRKKQMDSKDNENHKFASSHY